MTNRTPRIALVTGNKIADTLTQGAGSLVLNGAIGFIDADLSDTHTVTSAFYSTQSYDAQPYGVFSAVKTFDSNGVGSLNWTYTANANRLALLAAGQTAIEYYRVTITDNLGASTTQRVRITLTGTNDAPIIASSSTSNGGLAGIVYFNDADITDTHTPSVTSTNNANTGALSTQMVLDSTGGNTGRFNWTYTANANTLHNLADGQTKTETFNITLVDKNALGNLNGGSVVHAVSITLTGGNDAPELSANVSPANVYNQGALLITDYDVGDTHTARVTGTGVSGNVTTAVDGNHNLTWQYTPTANIAVTGVQVDAINSTVTPGSSSTLTGTGNVVPQAGRTLSAGETTVENFTITARDAAGATVSRDVHITLTGLNAAPVFGTATNAGNNMSGNVLFTDANIRDVHNVTVVPKSGTVVRGSLNAWVATDHTATQNNGVVSWVYTPNAQVLATLGANETRNEIFTITLSDGKGGTITRDITATMAGANVAPVIVSNTLNSNKISGTLRFTDSDLADSHTFTALNADNTVNTKITFDNSSLTPAAGGGVGQINWSYTPDAAQVQALAAGVKIFDAIKLRVSDTTQNATTTVGFILTGTNDAPLIGTSTASSATTGNITFTDPDVGDIHTVVITPQNGAQGTMSTTLTDGVAGNVAWTYTPNAALLASLAAGQTANETFTVTIKDRLNAVATQNVTVTMTGTNNAPVISLGVGDTAAATANIDADQYARATGTLNWLDADTAAPAVSIAAANGTTPIGTLQAVRDGNKLVWTYNATSTAVKALSSDAIDQFTVTLNDGQGGITTRNVAVTVHNGNSAPVVNATPIATAITQNTTSSGTLTSSGSFTFTDADLADLHTLTVTGSTLGTLNTYITTGEPYTSASSATRTVWWNYSVAANAVQNASGASVIDNFTISIDDGHGGIVTKSLVATANRAATFGASNAAPVATATASVGNIVKTSNSGTITTSGTFIFTDADVSDTHTINITGGGTGTLSINSNTNGDTYGTTGIKMGAGATGTPVHVVTWTYTVNAANVNTVASNTVLDTFTLNISDGNGGTTSKVVTINNTPAIFSRAGNNAVAWANGVVDQTTIGAVADVSITAAGVYGNNSSSAGEISPDGTKILFANFADNLVLNDTNTVWDLFVKDLTTGAITRVSTSTSGTQSTGHMSPRVMGAWSSDSNKIIFSSDASNLVSNDSNGTSDLFIKNLVTGLTTRVSTMADGRQVTGNYSVTDTQGHFSVFTPDATKIIFTSNSSDIITGDNNAGSTDIFVKDLTSGVVSRVSQSSTGLAGNGRSWIGDNDVQIGAAQVVSPDGNKVVFASNSTNLVTGLTDSNGVTDVFIKDLTTGTVTLLSQAADGTLGNGASDLGVAISPDGTKVAFASAASNLIGSGNDTNGVYDIFVKDLTTGTITRVNTNASGNQVTGGNSLTPVWSPDGTRLAFVSSATDVVTGDSNTVADVFVKNLLTGAITRVNTSATGTQSTGAATQITGFTADGSGLVLRNASALTAADTNATDDVYIKTISTATASDVMTKPLQGYINFSDADAIANSYSISVAPKSGTSVLGTLTAKMVLSPSADSSNLGRINWQYTVLPNVVDNGIAANQSQNDIFTITLTDNAGGIITKDVTINVINDGSRTSSSVATTPVIANNPLSWAGGVVDQSMGSLSEINTDSNNVHGNQQSNWASFNPNSTKVMFTGNATNLVSGDTNNSWDIFIKDLTTGAITRVSTDSTGAQGTDSVETGAINSWSADGTTILFASKATNMVTGDNNGIPDVFTKNLLTNITTRISTKADGSQATGTAPTTAYSSEAVFSPDGTKVLFTSVASDLVSADNNGAGYNGNDVYLKDLTTGSITRISQDLINGIGGNNMSWFGSSTVFNVGNSWQVFSSDGTKVIFNSLASNLVTGDNNGVADVFMKNLSTGAITLLSQSADGVLGNDNSQQGLAFSPDGTKVAFASAANNLVANDTNGIADIFIKDLITGVITRANINALGNQAIMSSSNLNAYSVVWSPDGTRLAFSSGAQNLVTGDTNDSYDIFVKNLITGEIERVNLKSDGTQSYINTGNVFGFTGDGSGVIFNTTDSLTPSDNYSSTDVYIRTISTPTASDVMSKPLQGYINFSDLDSSNIYSVSVAPKTGTMALGAMTANIDLSPSTLSNNLGRITWQYSVAPGIVDTSIAANQSQNDVFTVTLTDNAGSTITKEVVIKVVNDGTRLSAGVTPFGTVTGTLAFNDADLADTHTITSVAQSALPSGVFNASISTDSTNGTTGNVNWSYALNTDSAAYKALAAGQSLTDIFTVGLSNGQATRDVAVTITKPLNAPTLAAAVASSATTGSLSFTDTDVLDAHTVSVASSGTKGTLTTSVVESNGGTGSVNYVYTPSNKYAAGQSYSETFALTLTDAAGNSSLRNITLTGTGTNTAPTFASPVVDFNTIGALKGISTDSLGRVGNSTVYGTGMISPDGSKMLFASFSSNLVANDTNGATDLFIKDLITGVTTRVINADGSEFDSTSTLTVGGWSPDGTKIIFKSSGKNLVANDTNGVDDLFVKDLTSGVITRVNTTASGGQTTHALRSDGFGALLSGTFTPDSNSVVFSSNASNLATNDTNGINSDVFVKNLTTGAISLVSSNAAGAAGNNISGIEISDSPYPSGQMVSADGTKVLFLSWSNTLVAGDTNGWRDLFMKNLVTGEVTLINRTATGTQSNNDTRLGASFSPDGTKVAFSSAATNLISGDTNGWWDIFIKDLNTGVITRANVDSVGTQYGSENSHQPIWSPDGTRIAFVTGNQFAGDNNGVRDVYIKDLLTGSITLATIGADGTQITTGLSTNAVAFTPDGAALTFINNKAFDAADSNGQDDVYIKTVSVATASDVMSGPIKGFWAFTDVNTTDTHSISIAAKNGTTVLGSLTASVAYEPTTGSNNYGRINWQYNVTPSVVDAGITANGSRNDVFTITLTDNNGGTVTQDFTVKVVNDGNRTAVGIPTFNLPTINSTAMYNSSALGDIGWNTPASLPTVSAMGNKVVFLATYNGLVPFDTRYTDVFVKDTVTGAIIRANTTSTGAQSNGDASGWAQISADNTKVLFQSNANNLVSGDTNTLTDIFVKNLTTNTVTRVNTSATGAQMTRGVSNGAIFSPDATKVLFQSSSVLHNSDTNGDWDVYLKNLSDNSVTLVSQTASGVKGNNRSFLDSTDAVTWSPASVRASVQTFAADGTKVVFQSLANNLVTGDINGLADVFVKNLTTGAVTLVSSTANGMSVNGTSTAAAISPDGTKVAFASNATNLVARDTNAQWDLFVKDLLTGAVTRINTDSYGQQTAGGGYFDPIWSPDGTRISFHSTNTNLVYGSTTNGQDLTFVKDLVTGSVTLASGTTATNANGASTSPAFFSPDGSAVTYSTNATNMYTGDANLVTDIVSQVVSTATASDVGGTIKGVLNFSDANIGQTHTISIATKNGTTALGTLTALQTIAADANGKGALSWQYTVDAATVDAQVAAGGSRNDQFTITITDSSGLSSTQDLTVNVVNDPTRTVVADGASSTFRTSAAALGAAANSGSWTPASLGSSLTGWFDASDTSTMTKDGSGYISQWNDKSGNGYNAIQMTAANQPRYLNGTVNFGGTAAGGQDYMLSSMTANNFTQNSNKVSMFAVTQYDMATTTSYAQVAGFRDANAAFTDIALNTNHSTIGYAFDWQASATTNMSTYSDAKGKNTIIGAVTLGTSHLLSQNGTVLNYTTALSNAVSSASVLQIGADVATGLNRYMGGTISDLVLLKSALSTADRQKLEGYLAWKWFGGGTANNLPNDHPYKWDGTLFGGTNLQGDSAPVVSASKAVGFSEAVSLPTTTATVTDASNGAVSNAVWSKDNTQIAFYNPNTLTSVEPTSSGGVVYTKSLVSGKIENVVIANNNVTGAGSNINNGAAISADGTKIAFYSSSNVLTATDASGTNGDIFVRDLVNRTTTLVSSDATGANPIIGAASNVGIAFNATNDKIIFSTTAALVAADTNTIADIYVKNLTTGAIQLVSASASGIVGNNTSGLGVAGAKFSADGTKVVFHSTATNLVSGDTNAVSDVFVKDLNTGAVTLVSSKDDGTIGGGASSNASFSPDGSKVVYESAATNLLTGTTDSNGQNDIFVRNLTTNAVSRINTTSAGAQATGGTSLNATFSGDGSKIIFKATANNLTSSDTTKYDLFVKDLATGGIVKVTNDTRTTATDVDGVLNSDGTAVLYRDTSTTGTFNSDLGVSNERLYTKTIASTAQVMDNPNVSGNLTTSNYFTFTDADPNDTHTISVAADSGFTNLGTLTPTLKLDTTNGNTGIITWDYSVARSSVDALTDDVVRPEQFVISINDGHGGIATKVVTVNLIDPSAAVA